MSTVDPAGPSARVVATLWWVMLAGAIVIFGFVMTLLAVAYLRGGNGVTRERTWIVGLGLAFPLSVLAALTAYGLVVGERLLPRADGDVVQVSAEGRRWSWRFGYDEMPGRTTEDVLHIPAGRPVDVAITSTDVIHSFWVPRLAGKLDAIPGHVNVLRLEADAPGRYAGVSAEFSGAGYSDHAFTVVAHDETSWDDFLQEEEDE